ncbi:MAG: hypothetical protein AAGD96_10715, partial [Chloroflexota bacterium]
MIHHVSFLDAEFILRVQYNPQMVNTLGDQSTTQPEKTTPTQLLLTYLRPQGWMVIGLAVLVLGGISLQLINPQIIRQLLDGVQDGRPQSDLLTLAGLFIGLALLRQVVQLASTAVGEVVAW